jgi:hypothetical protein
MILLAILVAGAGAIIAWVVLAQPCRSIGSQQDPDPKGSDLHASNANFGNSLKGDNSNFGRCFYDE